MGSNPRRKDAAKLEEEIAKIAAQIDGISLSERQMRITALRDGLESEGVELTADDEEIIKRFAKCQCTINDLVKHFYGRFP